jgi:hypothetical protein
MKTRITKSVRKNMGLFMVNGELTDKYGRTFETFTDEQGFEDLRPVGVQRDVRAMRQARLKSEKEG